MENKHVGTLLLGMSAIFIGIIFLFNNAMRKIVTEGCPAVHDGFACPAYGTIAQQTYLSLAIVGLLVIVSLFLIFSKPSTRVIMKKMPEKKAVKIDLTGFAVEDRKVIELLQENKAMFQADIVDRTGFPKAKVTRVLDRLESHGIVERKRRGMNNLVVLK